jgi:PAS domain S-box-containing protein
MNTPETMMTSFYDVAVGLTTVLLLMALGWSVTLRRKVKEQAEKLRLQLLREAELERQFSDLCENANDMIYTHDMHGNFTSLNKAGERIIGYGREKAVGMSLREFVAPEQREWFDEWVEQCKAGTAPPRCELKIATPLGRRSVLEVSTRLIQEEGRPARIEGIGRDVTARKEAEEALRQSEERFSRAFRLSPVAIALSTLPEGRFIDVNESFLQTFDFSRELVIGRTANELSLWENDEDLARISKVLKDGLAVCGMECKFRTRSGGSRVALVFVEKIELSDATCAIFITHDITDRLNLESQLRQAQKLEAVGRLAAGVAHDFNNLLTVIQGHTQLAMARNDVTPAQSKSLEAVSSAAQRATMLTRQLLTFSRQQPMEANPLELNKAISDLTKMLMLLMNEKVDLKYDFGAGLPMVSADVTMLEQVVINLAVNACDAMPTGGSLTIGTRTVEVDADYVKNVPDSRVGRFVCLAVSDTGFGMDAATQARVFEPFFTTKSVGKGTGLGLATVYGIVKQHQGWIQLTSEVGKGTTFQIFFAAEGTAKTQGQAAATKARPDRPPQGNETVLVVEDEESVSYVVQSGLRAHGFRVLHAANALQAFQIYNEENGQIDLLLTDMVMPRGMSGRELAANLKALKPDLKVVYTTGYSREAIGPDIDLREGLNFLPKPHAPGKLIETVRARLAA